MASAKVSDALLQVTGSDDQTTAFESILDKIKSLSSPPTIADDLNAIAQAVFSASLGIVGTRTVVTKFISTLHSLENNNLWTMVGNSVLQLIQANTSSSSSLIDQVAALRELIATAHENNGNFFWAARTLSEIPLDSSQRRVPDAEKAQIWVRIMRNYLEEDDTTAAETYLNKLKNIMHTITDAELILHFKLSAARIQDSKRAFLAAAQSYHEISLSPTIVEEKRLQTLGMAIKCAILAPAGPPRSKVLGRLYKDERSASLEEFGILEKMLLDRLIAPEEVEKFAQGLQPHQLATTSDGSTVLAKAVVEHNLLAASKLYINIGFDMLGSLLGLDGNRAENTTAKMIEQGRLSGRIDQIGRLIWFEGREASGERGSGRAEVLVGKEMRRWDGNVQAVAEEVEHLSNALQVEFPEITAFMQEQLAT